MNIVRIHTVTSPNTLPHPTAFRTLVLAAMMGLALHPSLSRAENLDVSNFSELTDWRDASFEGGGYALSAHGTYSGNEAHVHFDDPARNLRLYASHGDVPLLSENRLVVSSGTYTGRLDVAAAGGSAALAARNTLVVTDGTFSASGALTAASVVSGVAQQNRVDISGGDFSGNLHVRGSWSTDLDPEHTDPPALLSENRVLIRGGSWTGAAASVVGAEAYGRGLASGNVVEIDGVRDASFSQVKGGMAAGADVTSNAVFVRNATVSSWEVVGGFSDDNLRSLVLGNIVDIEASTLRTSEDAFFLDVAGGINRSGDTLGNIVAIRATVLDATAGPITLSGGTSENGRADFNTVTLRDVRVVGPVGSVTVTGGLSNEGAHGNVVILESTTNAFADADALVVRGGVGSMEDTGNTGGNTVVFRSWHGRLGGLQNAERLVFERIPVLDDPMVTLVTDGTATQLVADVTVASFLKAPAGTTPITLLTDPDGLTGLRLPTHKIVVPVSTDRVVRGTLETDDADTSLLFQPAAESEPHAQLGALSISRRAALDFALDATGCRRATHADDGESRDGWFVDAWGSRLHRDDRDEEKLRSVGFRFGFTRALSAFGGLRTTFALTGADGDFTEHRNVYGERVRSDGELGLLYGAVGLSAPIAAAPALTWHLNAGWGRLRTELQDGIVTTEGHPVSVRGDSDFARIGLGLSHVVALPRDAMLRTYADIARLHLSEASDHAEDLRVRFASTDVRTTTLGAELTLRETVRLGAAWRHTHQSDAKTVVNGYALPTESVDGDALLLRAEGRLADVALSVEAQLGTPEAMTLGLSWTHRW